MSHFFMLLCQIWEISKYLSPRVIVQSHFKRMFNFKRSTGKYKKSSPFWSAFTWVVLLKILKSYCNKFGTWSLPSTAHSNYFKTQGSNFTSLVALIFPQEFDVLLLDYSSALFFDPTNQINDQRHSFTTV